MWDFALIRWKEVSSLKPPLAWSAQMHSAVNVYEQNEFKWIKAVLTLHAIFWDGSLMLTSFLYFFFYETSLTKCVNSMSTFQAQMAENKLRAFIVCLKMRRLFKI